MRLVRSIFLTGALAVGCSGPDPTAPVDDLIAPAQPADPARVRIVVSEVYELSNVIVAMTSYGRSSSTAVYKSGEYYQRVRQAFLPTLTEELIGPLQIGGDDPTRRYYEFRDNSFSYVFDNGLIKRNPAYETLWSPNLFRERLAAVQRFADATNFRAFYAANADFYRAFMARYAGLAEIDSIADWLEREFAPRRYDHYTVAISPLVYGSHSTHRITDTAGTEIIMFVSGPDIPSGTSSGVHQALVQRMVFTEIDHNFVNPVTDQHRFQVISAFADRATWTTDESGFYQSPVAVFNEYMTWGLFLLYIEGRISPQEFADVVALTTSQMEHSRKFQRFGLFARELLRLYRERPEGARVPLLYPAILEWAARQ